MQGLHSSTFSIVSDMYRENKKLFHYIIILYNKFNLSTRVIFSFDSIKEIKG